MSFYALSKKKRDNLVGEIKSNILSGIQKNNLKALLTYFSDEDTYIRKAGYLAIGKIYSSHEDVQKKIIAALNKLLKEEHHHVRQTVINAAGEIGKADFETVQIFFDRGLFDEHHSVRNAVIGSIKKMGQRNPKPVLAWAKKYLHHPDKEVRREVCHGIELRGRTHPQDILPLLKELQYDKTARVRNTLVHVLGQISYKKGCLETVIAHLSTWQNKELTAAAAEEILDMHGREDFVIIPYKQAVQYVKKHFKK